jgi:hypothetical protein
MQAVNLLSCQSSAEAGLAAANVRVWRGSESFDQFLVPSPVAYSSALLQLEPLALVLLPTLRQICEDLVVFCEPEIEPGQIKLIDKDIDCPNRIILGQIVFQTLGKQSALTAVFANDKTRHRILRPNRWRIMSLWVFSHSLDPEQMGWMAPAHDI